VPASGSLGVVVTGGGEDISVVEIDEIRVTAAEYLYLDDFDGGGVCRWSSGGGSARRVGSGGRKPFVG
jgi:hypothetical protein